MLPLEYPDKFYSSTSERSSRFFQVSLDAGIEATNLNPRQKGGSWPPPLCRRTAYRRRVQPQSDEVILSQSDLPRDRIFGEVSRRNVVRIDRASRSERVASRRHQCAANGISTNRTMIQPVTTSRTPASQSRSCDGAVARSRSRNFTARVLPTFSGAGGDAVPLLFCSAEYFKVQNTIHP